MKFHDLEIENFLTIKSAKVGLADRGLQLIQGLNEDDSSASSNGAGKSSLVDAIDWCLYGLTARDVKGDAVINLAAKKDCRVSLTMSNGASKYRVTRYRKHKEGKNSLLVELMGEAAVDMSHGTDAETQKVLEKIIGCSHEVFVAAVYSGQEIMPDLPKMKDRELKTLIEEAAGLQRIEKAYELARERMNTLKSAALDATNRVANLRADQTRAELAMGEVFVKVAQWEENKEVRVKESEDTVTEATRAMTKAGKMARDLLPACKSANTLVIGIDDKLAGHKRLETVAVAAERAVRSAELAIDTSLLKRLAAQVQVHETQIANAATECKKPCKECGTVLETMSVKDYIAHRTEHLDAAKLKLEQGKVLAREQVAKLLALRTDAATARAAVPDVSALAKIREESVLVINEWKAAETASTRCVADVKAAGEQLALRRTEPNPHQSALELSEKQVKGVVERLAAAATTLTDSTQNFEIASSVVKVFGPAGVRAQILDQVTPFLNERTADYLSALSDGEIAAVWTTLTRAASGDLKEKFSIDVTHAKGGDSFVALSGGEKRKVRLATALALQDLVASRATQPINLFIGDELDDALDPAGLERLMTILERRSRERGTVLLISHSDLKDWVDNVTTVRKTGQWHSVVEGALCS